VEFIKVILVRILGFLYEPGKLSSIFKGTAPSVDNERPNTSASPIFNREKLSLFIPCALTIREF
jgi:hypothetical protein